MKCAVISLGSTSSKMLVHALKNYFDPVDHINLKEIEFSISGNEKTHLTYRGKPLSHYDCMYIKGSFRYAMLLKSITQFFTNDKTYIPLDSESFITVNDKLLTHLELDKVKIPMPKTYVVPTVEAGKDLISKIKFPIIIKLPQGTHGKGVMVVDSLAAAKGFLDTLNLLKQPFIIQEYIECGGEDIRCFVVGDRVVASMKRKSKEGDIRSNLHSGGSAQKYDAPERMKQIAVKAAKQLKCDICGVDILETPEGGVVIEANVSPGLQGITKNSGVDVAEEIAKYLCMRTKEILEKTAPLGRKVIAEEVGFAQAANKPAQPTPQNIISKLEFRGPKIVIPENVVKLTGFVPEKDYVIIAAKDKLEIKKL